MASVVIPISKRTPQEELIDILKASKEGFSTSHVSEALITNKDGFLQDILTCLPELLNGQQSDISVRFTLIGYIFADCSAITTLIDQLELFNKHLESTQALAFLYGIANSGESRSKIFRAIYRKARVDSSLLTLIQPHLLKVEDFIRSWALPIISLKEIIEDLLEFSSVPSSTKVRLILTLLSESSLTQENIDSLIAKLINTASEFDLEKITELNTYHKASEVVKRLLSLAMSASGPEVEKYFNENQALLKSKGFSEEKVLEISRVIALVRLGNARVAGFKEIAEKLGVGESDVDYWVVRAVSNGMVKAKIDAISKEVFFEQNRLMADKKIALELIARVEKALSN